MILRAFFRCSDLAIENAKAARFAAVLDVRAKSHDRRHDGDPI